MPDPSPSPDDPLAALFSGKRGAPRVPSGRAATVAGAGGTFDARVLDLSQGGALFTIDDPRFYAGSLDGLSLVQRAFPDGLELTFLAETARFRAEVVRITPHDRDRVAIGCRFQRTLTAEEAVLLGVRAADFDHPEALLAVLPHAARPEAPVSLLLHAGRIGAGGPESLGRVRALGARVVEAWTLAPTLPAGDLVRNLLAQPLTATLVRGLDRLWEGPVVLLECRVRVEEPAPLLRLFAQEDLPRDVHARFARRG